MRATQSAGDPITGPQDSHYQREKVPKMRKQKGFSPESPFWFKNGTDHTPIPLFADSVKQFSY
jgi:hypothetical protein